MNAERTIRKEHLLGTWRIVKTRSTVLPSGEPGPAPLGPHAHGLATLGEHRMIAVVADNRPGDLPHGEERGWASYGGPYTFDGKFMVTTPDLTSGLVAGQGDQVREVSFEGHHLVLSPPARDLGNGRQMKMEFIWEKIDTVVSN